MTNDYIYVIILHAECEGGGIGRRARLRGVWFNRAGSSPVPRTTRNKFYLFRFFYFIKHLHILCQSPLSIYILTHNRIFINIFQIFSKKGLTISIFSGIILSDVADLCKGSTNDSDSFCPGSNPGSAAKIGTRITCSDFFVYKIRQPQLRLPINLSVNRFRICY